jgi:hypothetical protein
VWDKYGLAPNYNHVPADAKIVYVPKITDSQGNMLPCVEYDAVPERAATEVRPHLLKVFPNFNWISFAVAGFQAGDNFAIEVDGRIRGNRPAFQLPIAGSSNLVPVFGADISRATEVRLLVSRGGKVIATDTLGDVEPPPPPDPRDELLEELQQLLTSRAALEAQSEAIQIQIAAIDARIAVVDARIAVVEQLLMDLENTP